MAPKMKSRQKASQEYWEEREKEALKQTRLTEEQFAAEIEKIYGDMRREVNSRISNWYVRYADESGIDIAEAKKRVSKLDMEEYAELARKYVELARKEETRALAFTDEANEQMKLYNLTMKVNRLENLKAQIGLELCGGFSQLEKKYGTFLNEQMMEEFERQSGILAMTTQRPEAIRRQAEAVVNGSFHNATFSERLWNQQDALKGELDRLLSRALIQGLNPRAVAPELRKKFGASEQAADLLMITELCRVQTEAQKLAFQEYGYEEYTFICNGGACEACEGLSGKHFKVKDMQPGLNAPPMHPRCRCSTAAYMDREAFDKWLDALESGENVRSDEIKSSIDSKDINMLYSEAFIPKRGITDSTGDDIIQVSNASTIKDVLDELSKTGIKAIDVKSLEEELTPDEIIKKIHGLDRSGSCMSLAMAYIGNRNGLDVTDLRGGASADFFANPIIVQRISDLANGKTIKMENDFDAARLLLKSVKKDKEYLLSVGKHAAIVRKAARGHEYLRLQDGRGIGFKKLNDSELKDAFGCSKTHTYAIRRSKRRIHFDVTSLLFDISELKDNQDFTELLKYINTKE